MVNVSWPLSCHHRRPEAEAARDDYVLYRTKLGGVIMGVSEPKQLQPGHQQLEQLWRADGNLKPIAIGGRDHRAGNT